MIHPNFQEPPTLEDRELDEFGLAILRAIAKRQQGGMTCTAGHLPYRKTGVHAADLVHVLAQMDLVEVHDVESWGVPRYRLTDAGWERVEGGKPIWMD